MAPGPWCSRSRTTAAASHRSTWTRSSAPFSPPNRWARAPGSASPSATASWRRTAGRSGWTRRWGEGRASPSCCRRPKRRGHVRPGGRSMAETGSVRILVVEDDRALSEILCEELRAHGHMAVAAESVADGLEQLKQSDFEVGLLDLMLPDGSGIEILRQVASEEMPM